MADSIEDTSFVVVEGGESEGSGGMRGHPDGAMVGLKVPILNGEKGQCLPTPLRLQDAGSSRARNIKKIPGQAQMRVSRENVDATIRSDQLDNGR